MVEDIEIDAATLKIVKKNVNFLDSPYCTLLFSRQKSSFLK